MSHSSTKKWEKFLVDFFFGEHNSYNSTFLKVTFISFILLWEMYPLVEKRNLKLGENVPFANKVAPTTSEVDNLLHFCCKREEIVVSSKVFYIFL